MIIGISVALGIAYYIPLQPGSSTSIYVQNGISVSGGTCAKTFSAGLQPSLYSQNKSIVFLMGSNSTAQICVSYQVQVTHITSPATYQILPSSGVFQYHLHCTPTSCSGGGTAGNFTIITSPGVITLYPSNNVSLITIVYTIRSGVNARGFYSLEYLNQCPSFIPFADGYNPSQVNASDFPGFFQPNFGCQGSDYLSNGVITGLTGLNYTYIAANFTAP